MSETGVGNATTSPSARAGPRQHAQADESCAASRPEFSAVAPDGGPCYLSLSAPRPYGLTLPGVKTPVNLACCTLSIRP
jgi:hypothetical protein